MHLRHLALLAAVSLVVACANNRETVVDIEDVNKSIVLEVFAALESGDLETLERYFDPDGTVVVGTNTRKRGGPFASFREAAPFPGALNTVSVDVERIFAEGNQVAVQSMICGNQERTLLGIEPAGQRVCARYTNLYVLRQGRIVANTVGVHRDQIIEQLTPQTQ